MIRKILKIVLPITLVAAMLIGSSVSVGAITYNTTHIIDNDDAQGYSNTRFMFDTWFKADTLYYQDARIQQCITPDNITPGYIYQFPSYSRYTPIYAKVSAYLYNISFTDPQALYEVECTKREFYKTAGTINQDLAAPGWNTIGTAVINGVTFQDGSYATSKVWLTPSKGNNSKYCGADAIKIELGY